VSADEFEARVTRQLGVWVPRVVACPLADNGVQELRCAMLSARPRRFASPTECAAGGLGGGAVGSCQRALLYRAGDEVGECAARVVTAVTLEPLSSCGALCGGLCAEFRSFLNFLARNHTAAFRAVVCGGKSPCFDAAVDRILTDRLVSSLNYAASLVNRTVPAVSDLNLKLTAEFKGVDAASLRAPPSLASVVCAIWGGGVSERGGGKGCGRVELNCAEGLMHEEWGGEGVAPLRSMEEMRGVLGGCLRECAEVARGEVSALCRAP
jgi:hypothetical protein